MPVLGSAGFGIYLRRFYVLIVELNYTSRLLMVGVAVCSDSAIQLGILRNMGTI